MQSLRHAATLAEERTEHRSQNFDSEDKPHAKRGASHPAVSNSHATKIVNSKKTKLMAVQDPSHYPGESSAGAGVSSVNDAQYSPRNVVAKMLMKKDRKIPGSCLKPHSEEIVLL